MKKPLVAALIGSSLVLSGCSLAEDTTSAVTQVVTVTEEPTGEEVADALNVADPSSARSEPAPGLSLGKGTVEIPIGDAKITCDVYDRVSCSTKHINVVPSPDQLAHGGYPAVNLEFVPGDAPKRTVRNDAPMSYPPSPLPDEALSQVNGFAIDTTGDQVTITRGGQTYLLAHGRAEKIADGAGAADGSTAASGYDAKPATAETSAQFADEVLQAWLDAGKPNFGTISAFSPVTQQTYSMECSLTHNGLNFCSGGNNAVVHIYPN